ncbi:MAG: RNA-binding protein [Candidatus Muiribacteriota bacterium]|jgi:RNA recognition motif-containing protein
MKPSKIYVGNLKYEVTNKDLREVFSPFGEVKSVFKIEGKNFAFVEMADGDQAEKAVKELNGKSIKDRPMKVQLSRPSDKRRFNNNFKDKDDYDDKKSFKRSR